MQGCEALAFLCPLHCTICLVIVGCRWGKFHNLLFSPPSLLLPMFFIIIYFSFSQYSSLLFLSSTIVLLGSTFVVIFLTLLRFFFSSSTPFLPQPSLFINIIYFSSSQHFPPFFFCYNCYSFNVIDLPQ